MSTQTSTEPAVTARPPHKVVTREEWTAARKQFLQKEKQYTRLRDELTRERMELPWEKVTENYVFDGPNGKVTLSDLFDGRSQLIIQHFMFGPHETTGCVGCSFSADSIDSSRLHLENHDVSLVAVSRAPIEVLEAFKKRMGWHFQWVSSGNNNFNYDYHVSFHKSDLEKGSVYYNYGMLEGLSHTTEDLPGLSCFYKDAAGDIYHTYSTYARGGELQLIVYNYLDIAPLGRNEGEGLTDWVRHHDKYQSGGKVDPTGKYHEENTPGSCCNHD
jgi:predicted dithiol-disulfide oxidoreductase (DUF899 family)